MKKKKKIYKERKDKMIQTSKYEQIKLHQINLSERVKSKSSKYWKMDQT